MTTVSLATRWAPLVPDLLERAPTERQAPHDVARAPGHVVLRRGDVGVLAVRREAGGGRFEVRAIEVVPDSSTSVRVSSAVLTGP
jgi:hypothetical protein